MPTRDEIAAYRAALGGGYSAPPWARPSSYADRPSTLGDLIGRQGQIQADRHMSGANMLAQGVQQAGQQLGRYFEEREAKKEMAKRDAATMQLIETWDGQDPTQLFAGLSKIRPQDALQYTNTVLALRKGPQKDPDAELARFGKVAQFMKDQPDEVIERAWPAIRKSIGSTAAQLGLGDAEQWDPKFRPIVAKAGELWGPKQEGRKVGTLSPGAVAFDETTGEIIAKGPEKPAEKKLHTLSPGSMMVDESGAVVAKAPRAPSEPKAADRQWVLRDGEATRVTEAEIRPGDQPYAAKNTTEKDTGTVGKVLDSIDALSKKINTGSGPMARAAGVFRGRTAGLNLDPDVQEYDSLVSGFTPIVARAVGHTGVLTEQDVDSVRKLFPSPGDSTEVRDRKVAQLRRLMSQGEAEKPGARGPIRPIPDKGPKAGAVEDGYRFKGGNPADPSSWEKVR